MQTNSDKSNGLKLSYDVSEIISSDTKTYLLHKNPLANAESLVKKNQFKSALEIYSRTLSKITEESIQNKIKANIIDIQNYLKAKDPDFEKNYPSKFTNIKEKEFNKSLEEFSESLSDSLTEKLNVLKQIETVPEIEVDREFPYDLGKLQTSNFPEKKDKNKQKKSLPNKPIQEEIDDSEPELELTAELSSEEKNDEKSYQDNNLSSGNTKDKKQKGKLNLPEDSFKSDINLESIQIDQAEIEANDIQTNSETYNDIYTPDSFITSKSSEQNQEELAQEINESDEFEEEIKPKRKSKKNKKKSKKKQTNQITESEEEDTIESDSTDEDIITSSSYSTEVVEIPTSTEVKIESYTSEDEKEDFISKKEKSSKKKKSSNTLNDSIDTDYQNNSGYSPINPISEPVKVDTGFQPIQKETIPKFDSQNLNPNNLQNPSTSIPSDTTKPESQLIYPGNLQNPPTSIPNDLSSSKDSNFFNPPSLLPNLPFNLNEKLSALYYSNEWDNFKKLPIKNRRSGKDRRVKESKLPSNQKDRRSGKDRRVSIEDKLKIREEFLKNWEKNIQIPDQSQDIFPETILDSPFSSYGGNQLEFLPREPILPTSKMNLPTQPLEKLNLPTGSNQELPKQPQETLTPPTQEMPAIPISEVKTQPIANSEVSTLSKSSDSQSYDSPNPETAKSSSPQNQELPKPKETTPNDLGSGAGQTIYSAPVSEKIETVKIELPDPKDYVRSKTGHLVDPFEEAIAPEINIEESDSELPESTEEDKPEISGLPEIEEPKEQEKIIHGVLELKPPEIDDAPFLTLTYDFSKIPHPFRLSKNYSIMEYSYYKYKPMLMKAQEFARRKMLKNALNYYRVIKSQNIPPELKSMINRNIMDITEFLEKFTMSKGG